MRIRPTIALAGAIFALAACDDSPTDFGPTPSTLTVEKIGGFTGGGAAAAEITAFDPGGRRLFVVNGALGTVDVLDLSTPSAPAKVGTISVAQLGAGVNSVAVYDGLVALAVEGAVKTDAGKVALYRAATLELLGSATVGALPDMVAFTPNGRYVLAANEGEPNDAYTVDPTPLARGRARACDHGQLPGYVATNAIPPQQQRTAREIVVLALTTAHENAGVPAPGWLAAVEALLLPSRVAPE
jgi:hypothetical protein